MDLRGARPLSSVPGETFTEHAIIPWQRTLRLKPGRNVKRLLWPAERNAVSFRRVARWCIRSLKRERAAAGQPGFIPVSDINVQIRDWPTDPGIFPSRLVISIDIIDDPDGSLKARFGGRLRASGDRPTIWIGHPPTN